MEITIDIRYEQLLETIKKLPAAKIRQLKSSLDENYINVKASEELSSFREFLLNGPVMDEEQYVQYKKNRKHFSLWRQRESA